MTDFEYEKQKLKEILEAYQEVITDTQFYLRSLESRRNENPVSIADQIRINENRLRLLENGLEKPYFARIDFKEQETGRLYQLYIGKVGVTDFDKETVVIDWRAPIASMYYDSNIGETSYEAPDGVISGNLLVKRQINIENGQLLSFQDVDTVSNDDLLKDYLGVTADSRLKNIVSTIQAEQNEIIREKLFKNLIVQGVAGSGKTTVALHRIAYLVYNNAGKINTDQFMVIGPNSFFIDYISNVLPDLDASTVVQTTFDKLVQDFIGEQLIINPSEKQLISSLQGGNLEVCKFKNSLKYKQLLDRFMMDLDSQIVPDKDFIVKGLIILPQEVVKQFYDEVEKDRFETIESRIERTVLLLSTYIENSQDLQTRISDDSLSISPASREFIGKELRNGFRQSLKQYLIRQINKSITYYYQAFIATITDYAAPEDMNLVTNLKKSTIKKGTYDFDDLAALAYLKYSISGPGEYTKYRHVVIDEAQDYGDFNFTILNKMMKNSSFSIYGDIAQSIYSYRSIDSWDSVAQIFEKTEIKELLKSYRTTIEVMNQANYIINHIGLSPATPVIRNGDEVGYLQISNEITNIIYSYIVSYLEKKHSSIAIICKSVDSVKIVYRQLKQYNLPIQCVTSSEDEYKGGICITTAYLSKGLEFDAVLIADASELEYSSENENDMKLLYVAMTRALHNLDILYQGELTKPLYEGNKKKLNGNQFQKQI